MTRWAVYDRRGRWALWGIVTVGTYQELTDGDDDYINDLMAIGGWSLATGALLVPELVPRIVGFGVTHAWSGLRWAGAAAAPYVGTAVSTVVAPVAAGYVIGATVGTVIANEIWGEEGAQTALGFYSGGLLPGTEAPDLTDYQYIFKPSAPGGPVSLYDVAETAVSTTVVLARKFLSKSPTLGRRRPKSRWSPLWYIM
jgi:hypothetical protein